MDVQNATEAASMKPAASSSISSSSRPPESERSEAPLPAKPTAASSLVTSLSNETKPSLSKPSSLPTSATTPSQLQSSNPPKDASKDATKDTPKSSLKDFTKSASKDAPKDSAPLTTVSPPPREKQDDDGGATDGNSEAETIVLSKDASPAKPRNLKVIKHEDKRDGGTGSSATGHTDQAVVSRKYSSDRKEGAIVRAEKAPGSTAHGDGKGASLEAGYTTASVLQQKKKRLQEKQLQASSHPPHFSVKRASSSLSSTPASPPRSRQHSSNPHSGSDSDRRAVKSPKHPLPLSKDRLRPSDKFIPSKRKAPKAESDDESEIRKARRQRLNGSVESHGTAHPSKAVKSQAHHSNHNNHNGTTKPPGPRPPRELSASRPPRDPSAPRPPRDPSAPRPSKEPSTSRPPLKEPLGSRPPRDLSATRPPREPTRFKSTSPPPRVHRRSMSTQFPSQTNGLGLKKKRVPPPLQSTDYRSDESSNSGGVHARISKPRGLATPATADSAGSPAKIGPHKKHLDAHGQTFLARACARGEYELAKQRLVERPDDLNTADFAGNTPLQIAALNGYGDIVKLLIDAGCILECVNYDKDTPLLDAVENGHYDVVKLLLEAGVSPRKANVHGEEPLDRVNTEMDNASDIRALLVNAKKREGERRHTSEEHRHEHDEHRSLHGADSPRQSPAPSGLHAAAMGRRAGTARATKTSNHLLYMPMDDKTLRQAAGKGDEETVTRILQVREAFDDPESMVAAARGGHDIVMQLLLALGNANPDPDPIVSAPAEHATPMLAAIGQENLKVVSLLLEQNSFDPTRRFHGNAYYEIARQRAGPNWKDEEDLLKTAYDDYKKAHGGKDGKLRSPVRKDPEQKKAEPADEASSRAHKRKVSSPSQERGKKIVSSKPSATGSSTSPREERLSHKRADRPERLERPDRPERSERPERSDHPASQADGRTSPRRTGSGLLSAGKHKRDDRSSVTSGPDRDTPPPIAKQIAKPKKNDSELVPISSEGETVKPRRKLISGKELKDEKEKQRRASLASTSTVPLKESTSPRETRGEDNASSDKARAEKHRDRDRDRARQLKSEELRESTSGADGGSTKRHRLSETPPRLTLPDKDTGEASIKRRRLEGVSSSSGKERRVSKVISSDDTINKPASSSLTRESLSKTTLKRRDDDDRKGVPVLQKTKKRDPSLDRNRKSLFKPVATEKSIHVKSEDVDIEMTDVDVRTSTSSDTTSAEGEARGRRMREEGAKAAAAEAAASKKKDEEARRLRQEEEAKCRKDEEDRRKREDEKRKREEEAKRKEEEARKKKEEEKKEKERRKLEEEERKHKEEERRRKEGEEKRKHREEEERKKRAEEEREREEKREKEAAEEARLKREEAERKERERHARELEEQERARVEREAEEARRRQAEEKERVRISKLPALLQWLCTTTTCKTAAMARKFRVMQGVRYDCIDPSTTGSVMGREQWILNSQAALVLGDSDLSLAKYPLWQHAPVTAIAKRIIWRLETDRYALTDPELYELGRQLPEYYGGEDPDSMGYQVVERLRGEAWEKFSATDMFFVKATDMMSIVPALPHLHNVQLVVAYRELPEEEAQLASFAVTQKWKNDPNVDRFYGFAPRNKYYVNGEMVKEEMPGFSAVSKTPFPEIRVPRRHGIAAVAANEPEYANLCKEQGIKPVLANGCASSPKPAAAKINGKTAHSHSTVNGDSGGLVSPQSPAVNDDRKT